MGPDIATGYFTYLMNIDVGKFTYFQLSHDIHYNLQQQLNNINTNQISAESLITL